MSAKPIGPSADSPAKALHGAEAERAQTGAPTPAWKAALVAAWAAILAALAWAGRHTKATTARIKAKRAESKAKAEASGAPAKKPWYMRGATIAAVVFLVLIVSLYVWVKIPAGVTAYSDPVSQESRDANAHATAALAAGFIEDPFIDIDDDRAYVAYNLPSSANGTATLDDESTIDAIDTDPDLMQRFVLGSLAAVAPDVEKVVAVQYIEHRPSWMWTMQMDDFKAFMRGEIDIDELDERIDRKHL